MSRPAAPRGHHPGTLPLADALDASASLARLLQQTRESRRRFDIIGPLLPPALRETVRPGPIDDEGWSLLADHGAAAAKLRQLLPRLESTLRDSGCSGTAIRVRVQPRTGG